VVTQQTSGNAVEPPGFDLKQALPVLQDPHVTLRELRSRDAAGLLAQVSPPEVLRYIAPAPATVAALQSFIRWTHKQRRRRLHAAFGLIPAGMLEPVGILQIWPVELDWSTAEWGIVVGQGHWGTGLFDRGARLMLDFAFDTMGVLRLEARSADVNQRGNGALRRLGAVSEGTLRGSFRQGERVGNHLMWSILASEWRSASRAGQSQAR